MKKTSHYLLLIFLFTYSGNMKGQVNNTKKDSISVLGGNSKALDSLNSDPNKIIEDAALDIGQNRGLFIVTPDGKMQMRILGSVRYLIVYDEFELTTKSSFYTTEIPTGDEKKGPANYYNELSQSRLGFEITRNTTKGNVFVRLETDFAGANGFRIRHAYGQFQKFILGQTWSLFSQVSATPSTVDFTGPSGTNIVRTPQIRYTAQKLIPGLTLAFALEYFKPEVTDLDSLGSNVFQLIPDISIRIDRKFDWGSMQFSTIIPTLTAELSDGDYISQNGFGLSISAIVKLHENGKLYTSLTGGRAIARFFGDFAGRQLDLIIDSDYNVYTPLTAGGFVTYEHYWSKKLFSNFSYSFIFLEQFSFYPEGFYKYGQSIHINTFWNIVDGAKLGLEYIWGQRNNNIDTYGNASRLNAMIYYDF